MVFRSDRIRQDEGKRKIRNYLQDADVLTRDAHVLTRGAIYISRPFPDLKPKRGGRVSTGDSYTGSRDEKQRERETASRPPLLFNFLDKIGNAGLATEPQKGSLHCHRARAAFRALFLRCRGVSFAMDATPPAAAIRRRCFAESAFARARPPGALFFLFTEVMVREKLGVCKWGLTAHLQKAYSWKRGNL